MVDTEHYLQEDSLLSPRQIRQITQRTDNLFFEKVTSAVTEHTELLALLIFRQPMSGRDIRKTLGISKRKMHTALKRLVKVGVVFQVKFESHTLYVVNSEHDSFIRSCIDS